MKKIKEYYLKYKEIINYLVFGVLTTLVSIITYYLLSLIYDIDNDCWFVIANIISWTLAVIFAYFTNQRYVFETSGSLIKFISFIFSRLFTLLIELLGMYILVKVIHYNDMYSKILMQVIIIILNYIIGKFLVFKKTPRRLKRKH